MIDKEKCFIIAELSANHGSNIEIAKETISAAKRAGADAIKMQTYRPDTMTLNYNSDDFVVQGGTLWDGKNLYELYQEAHLPWDWHKELFDHAKALGLICFSTPFDITAVDFLEELDCPIYKIASFEITDIPLIRYTASKGKPMILSTGIAEYDDIKLAIETCKSVGNHDITILKCTSSYPAPIEEANLSMIPKFAEDFGVKVGLSDHTMGNLAPVLSIAMGAKVIEKHFILDRSIGGADAAFSMNEKEFTDMVTEVRKAEKALGIHSYELTSKQKSGRRFSRSLYVSEDIKSGELLSSKNIKSIRPGFGLHPKFYNDILGKKANKNLKKGTRLNMGDLEES